MLESLSTLKYTSLLSAAYQGSLKLQIARTASYEDQMSGLPQTTSSINPFLRLKLQQLESNICYYKTYVDGVTGLHKDNVISAEDYRQETNLAKEIVDIKSLKRLIIMLGNKAIAEDMHDSIWSSHKSLEETLTAIISHRLDNFAVLDMNPCTPRPVKAQVYYQVGRQGMICATLVVHISPKHKLGSFIYCFRHWIHCRLSPHVDGGLKTPTWAPKTVRSLALHLGIL
ncbi:hypothetical protein LOZ39_004414 [Ophidiomyces ophidiicola]|nr:hypothetical protein LOZ49_006261 [Ophidiomyces ophidiicola]KAI2012556.1 hypothetical protein LOZ50_000012 [Ophidiomyces ophidiicola]KAI2053196.1 hypothetical protein LOZ44_002682 [Ophidiomyces ophidiicola]KAI2072201.1 hypothetical protein LOZ39_004414 [Ophidiomyces ophidiicola]KAI2133661.1 hypothetical protein LOZ29_004619 [Ophidiomyces ophidiicola]